MTKRNSIGVFLGGIKIFQTFDLVSNYLTAVRQLHDDPLAPSQRGL